MHHPLHDMFYWAISTQKYHQNTWFRGDSSSGKWDDMVKGEPSIAIEVFQNHAWTSTSNGHSLWRHLPAPHVQYWAITIRPCCCQKISVKHLIWGPLSALKFHVKYQILGEWVQLTKNYLVHKTTGNYFYHGAAPPSKRMRGWSCANATWHLADLWRILLHSVHKE